MTAPLRRSLLNTEIVAEARRIAHAWTPTCRGEGLPGDAAYHTNHCNQLFAEILELAMAVKLARMQPPKHNHTPPPFQLGAPQYD